MTYHSQVSAYATLSFLNRRWKSLRMANMLSSTKSQNCLSLYSFSSSSEITALP